MRFVLLLASLAAGRQSTGSDQLLGFAERGE